MRNILKWALTDNNRNVPLDFGVCLLRCKFFCWQQQQYITYITSTHSLPVQTSTATNACVSYIVHQFSHGNDFSCVHWKKKQCLYIVVCIILCLVCVYAQRSNTYTIHTYTLYIIYKYIGETKWSFVGTFCLVALQLPQAQRHASLWIAVHPLHLAHTHTHTCTHASTLAHTRPDTRHPKQLIPAFACCLRRETKTNTHSYLSSDPNAFLFLTATERDAKHTL